MTSRDTRLRSVLALPTVELTKPFDVRCDGAYPNGHRPHALTTEEAARSTRFRAAHAGQVTPIVLPTQRVNDNHVE
jgi:hypothetical protein